MALGIERRETAFDSGFAGMAARAKALKVFERERQLGVRPHRLDVIDFEPAARAA
ncbi:MAG: hypothetical protein M5U33_11150 [Pseudorhodoplanes sp.]|nr:hypothetical protein [Pseudorhodoplanes sp.]